TGGFMGYVVCSMKLKSMSCIMIFMPLAFSTVNVMCLAVRCACGLTLSKLTGLPECVHVPVILTPVACAGMLSSGCVRRLVVPAVLGRKCAFFRMQMSTEVSSFSVCVPPTLL